MSIKYKNKSGKIQDVTFNASEIQVLDTYDQFKSNDVEGVLKELALGQGNIGGTSLNDIQQLKEDKTNILKELYSPNLLDNGYFNNPINTQNKIIYSNIGYESIDRWKMLCAIDDGSFTLELKDGYITFKMTKGSENSYIIQDLEKRVIDMIKGKQCSISIRYRNKNNNTFRMSLTDNLQLFMPTSLEWTEKSSTAIVEENVKSIIIQNYNGTNFVDGSIDIEWIKLEIGDRATKFIPKSYEEEFNSCVPYRNVISNPNLLINGDFQVWQRGEIFTFDTNKKYSCDRWGMFEEQFKTGNGTVSLNKAVGKTELLIRPSEKDVYHFIQQSLDEYDSSKLSGKYITVSVKMRNSLALRRCDIILSYSEQGLVSLGGGTSESRTSFNVPSVTNKVFTFTTLVPKNIKGLSVAIGSSFNDATNEDYLAIEYIKLELGSVATPFVPRPYAEEEMLCKRYYEKKSTVLRCSNGVDKDLLRVNLCIIYEVTKRIIPNIQIYGYNQEKNTIVGKVAFDPTNFPIKIYNNTIEGIGAIDIVDLKEKTLNASEMFECYGYEADAEIY